jgi:MFS transporter, ACS family, glucarate transporter
VHSTRFFLGIFSLSHRNAYILPVGESPSLSLFARCARVRFDSATWPEERKADSDGQRFLQERTSTKLIRRFPVRSLLVFWLFVLSAVAFLDRTNISIAGPHLRDDLHIDNIRLGWIFSAFLLGYAAFQVPGGWLAYRFGPRRILALGVLWWGAFTALTAISSTRLPHALLILIAVRFLLGAGESVMYPASNQFVARWIPVAERGRANGWIFAGVGAGPTLGVPIFAWLITDHGWRASFWFSAVLGVAAGLVWFAISRDTPEQHPRISPAELTLIQSTRNVDQPAEVGPKRSLSADIFNRNVAALSLSYFAFGYIAWNFFSWFFIYLAEARGLELKSNTFFSMIPFISLTVCCLGGGWISDQISRRFGMRLGRCGIGVFSFALTAIFLIAGPQARNSYSAGVILACGAGALYLSQSSFWAVSANLAGERSGVVSGVMNMVCQIGSAVTASLTPYLAGRFGWNSAFDFAAVIALAGGVLWFFVDPGASPLRSATKPHYAETRPA